MGNKKQLTIEDIPEFIFGFEGEGEDGDKGEPGKNSGDDPEDEEEDAGGASKEPSGDEHDDKDDPDVKGLKAALAAERKEKKTLEREKKLWLKEKADKDLAEKGEIEQKTTKLSEAEQKLARVASGYLKNSLDAAITKAAEKAGFLDAEDALAGVDRTDLAEQDDDDPSDVEIDEAEVAKRVKALATKKPHYIKSGTSDDEPTGGQFGGGKKQKPKANTKEAYAEQYPGL